MATKVELPTAQVRAALEMKMKSLIRSKSSTINPLMHEIIDKEVHQYQNAMNTLTETK